MTTAIVKATSLNLRDAAGGTVIDKLAQNLKVEVLKTTGGWSEVQTLEAQPRHGWVSAQFLAVDVPPAAGVPPPDDAAHPVTVSGQTAVGPDGTAFARRFKLGFFTIGQTSLSAWLAAGGDAGGVSESAVRVIRAVSRNEGRLEAVNSWDNAHISFGMFQWTAGPGDDPGELACLIRAVKQVSADAWQDCFGRYGLDSDVTSDSATTGRLTLNGAALSSSAQKEQLRNAAWAYRFWRAGKSDGVRKAELALAARRIGRFIGAKTQGFAVGQWLSSEHGVALVLDEHVNRPGHVPGTLGAAISALPGGAHDPTGWTQAQEHALIDRYVDARDDTSMTDPDRRAGTIGDAATRGEISDARGSFQA